jgi:hypothetical protein
LPSRLDFTRWLLMLNSPSNPQKIIAIHAKLQPLPLQTSHREHHGPALKPFAPAAVQYTQKMDIGYGLLHISAVANPISCPMARDAPEP